MTDRVHAALDGEIPREALTDGERERLIGLESALADAATALRAVPAPDLTARVMDALPWEAAAPRAPGVVERLAAWLWRPWELNLRLRPVYGLVGAAAALALTLLPAPAPLSGPVAEAERPPTQVYVQFRLEAPSASQVELTGSFTGWAPEYVLQETAPGVWSALVPLEPGVHDYAFVVDGAELVADPVAPQVDDGFGGTNSRLFLAAPTVGA